jgi:hypothetical protein
MRCDLPNYHASRRDFRRRRSVIAAEPPPFMVALVCDRFGGEALKNPHAHLKYRLPVRMLPLLERVIVRHVLQEFAKLVRKCIT